MIISTGRSKTDQRWRNTEMSWEELCERLRTPFRTSETTREYRGMSKDDRDRRKDVGGFVGGRIEGGKRRNGSVQDRCLITLDADQATPGLWQDVTCLYDWRMCVYSTHSHTPEAPRLRFVIPLSRTVTPEEYTAVSRKVAQYIGIDCMDSTTYQAARLMYWPSVSVDGEYLFKSQDGPVLDPDEVLRSYGLDGAWKDASLWPMGAGERDLPKRSAKKQGDPESKPGMVGLFCRAYDVPAAISEFLRDVYTECDHGRYTYAAGSTAAGAVLYEGGKFLYSNHGTDPAGGQLLNAFDLVRVHKFGAQDEGQEAQTETNRLPSYEAMCRWAADLPEIKRRAAEERIAAAEQDFADLGGETALGDAETGETDSAAWVDSLQINHKTGEADPTIENALLILENDPAVRGCIGYNAFTARPSLLRDVPWRSKGYITDQLNGVPWTDADDAGMRYYLEKVWKLKSRQAILDGWQIIMDRQAYHPIREYLDSLSWDGVERLDTLLVRYMKAKDTPYVRAVTRKFFTAAVARIYSPGCKYDNMLVLVGPQGKGKSSLAYTMSRGWFTDSLQRLDDKSAYEGLRGIWIAELAELAAQRRSEIETVKNFVSKRVDTYRPAYGRHLIDFPRQCVMYGTTNDAEFLKDRTGNRRFWPVGVDGVAEGTLDGLEEERDQLWAEALHRYRAGEALWLSDASIRSAAREEQERYSEQDELVGELEEFLNRKLPEKWPSMTPDQRADYMLGNALGDFGPEVLDREEISLPEIRCEMFGQNRREISSGRDQTCRRLSAIMNTLPGWKKQEKKTKLPMYGAQWTYRREKEEEK